MAESETNKNNGEDIKVAEAKLRNIIEKMGNSRNPASLKASAEEILSKFPELRATMGAEVEAATGKSKATIEVNIASSQSITIEGRESLPPLTAANLDVHIKAFNKSDDTKFINEVHDKLHNNKINALTDEELEKASKMVLDEKEVEYRNQLKKLALERMAQLPPENNRTPDQKIHAEELQHTLDNIKKYEETHKVFEKINDKIIAKDHDGARKEAIKVVEEIKSNKELKTDANQLDLDALINDTVNKNTKAQQSYLKEPDKLNVKSNIQNDLKDFNSIKIDAKILQTLGNANIKVENNNEITSPSNTPKGKNSQTTKER